MVAVVPIYWIGEDGYLADTQSRALPGYLLDTQPQVSPEDMSFHQTNAQQDLVSPEFGSSLSAAASPEEVKSSPSIQEYLFEDAIFDVEESQLSVALMKESDNYMVLYNGNAEVVGNFRALNFYKASDINIKEDIRLLEGGMSTIRAHRVRLSNVFRSRQQSSTPSNQRSVIQVQTRC